jgi:anti-sigma factor RsiW
MPDRNLPVTEDELHAYVDGELPSDRLGAVESWLATHPADAARVATWRAQAEAIRTRFSGIGGEPVPERLTLANIAHLRRPSLALAAAAALVALVLGGGAGWWARGAPPVRAIQQPDITAEALQAHRLYTVEVRHPVEVSGAERDHLVRWLSKRLDYEVMAPQLDNMGLKLVGGRLLPGQTGPAAFLMYEGQSGERFTIYCTRSVKGESAMRYNAAGNDAAFYWIDDDVAYVVSGDAQRERLQKIAQAVYEQMENRGRQPGRASENQVISRRGS